MRSKIVYHPDEHSNLTATFLMPIWQEYFDCEPLDTTKTYDKGSTIFWSKHLNQDGWYLPYQADGYKIVIDHLWDNPITVSSVVDNNTLTLQCGNWIWYNESLWYKWLGYDTYQSCRSPEKFFLMLMRKKNDQRDMILIKMRSFLDDCLYSYVEKGILLDVDIDPMDDLFQRHFNPAWYDQTCFSMVAESTVRNIRRISEKSFKPMAFRHPFVIWGEPYTLDYLRQQGFQTFDHIINESYDQVVDNQSRLEKIYKVVEDLYHGWQQDPMLFCDSISIEKIQHNFNLFYDSSIPDRFKKEIVGPLMEFARA